jgi:hypothetical protein
MSVSTTTCSAFGEEGLSGCVPSQETVTEDATAAATIQRIAGGVLTTPP